PNGCNFSGWRFPRPRAWLFSGIQITPCKPPTLRSGKLRRRPWALRCFSWRVGAPSTVPSGSLGLRARSASRSSTTRRRSTLHRLPSGCISSFLASRRLPAMYQVRENVVAGGLLSYGPSLPDLFRRGAGYVHKILQGTRPADLPVEQPTKFDLTVNHKTAKAL